MRILLRRLKLVLFSSTARDTLLVFATYLTTSVLAFFYTVFLARAFSPQNLGIFSAITAFILLASDVLDLGISASLSRFYPEIKNSEGEEKAQFFLRNTFKFQLIVTLFLITLVIFAGPILSRLMFRSDDYSGLYIFAGLGILATVLLSYSTASLAAQRKFFRVSLLTVTSTLIKLILLFYLFSVQRFTIQNVTVSFVLAPLIAFTLSLKFVRLSYFRKKFNFALLKRLLSYSAFVGAARIFSAISSRFDALMLIPLSSAYEAGIYSAAYKIIFTYILISGSFSTVIAPRLSAFKKVRDSLPYLKKITLVVICLLLSMLVMYFLAPVFVPFVLGKDYLDSIAVFRSLLIPAALFVSTVPTVNFLLYVAKKPQVSLLNTAVQFVFILFGNLYFIPKYGRFGPVYTLSVVCGFTLLSSLFFTFYYLKHE